MLKSKTNKKHISSPKYTLEHTAYARAAESFDGTEATLFSKNSEISASSLANSRSNSAEWSSSFLSEVDNPQSLLGLNVKSIEYGHCHDATTLEEADEIMFRQDPAWTKTLRFATHVSILPCIPETTDTLNVNQQTLGSFEYELEKTTQWMNQSYSSPKKKLDVHDNTIPYQMSERSKKFDRFLPTFTPFFLGDIIRDDELDGMLQELLLEAEKDEEEHIPCAPAELTDAELSASYQTESSITSLGSVTRKKTKKKKKFKSKISTNAFKHQIKTPHLEEFWLICPNSLELNLSIKILLEILNCFYFDLTDTFSEYSQDSLSRQVFKISRKMKAQSLDCYLIEKKIKDLCRTLKESITLSRVAPDSLDTPIHTSNVTSESELSSLYLESETEFYTCICIDKTELSVFINNLQNCTSSILGIQYVEKLDIQGAKLLVFNQGLTKDWKAKLDHLLESKQGWVVLFLRVNSNVFKSWNDHNYNFVSHPADSLEWIQSFFTVNERSRIFSQLNTFQDESVICLIRWSLFSQLGRILKRAQNEGFVVCGLKTTRLHENTLHKMFEQFQQGSVSNTLEKKLVKFMSVGPVIAVWLKQRDAISKWLHLLKSVYEHSEYEIPFYTEGLLAPSNSCISIEWSKLVFPHGPTVDYTYQLHNNSLCRIQRNTYISSFSRSSIPKTRDHLKSSYPRNVVPFNILLSSHDNQVECNIEKWGTIIEKILCLKTKHHQVRLEKCALLNVTMNEAIQIVDSIYQPQQYHSPFDVTKGPCLFLRFSAEVHWDKFKTGSLLTQPCIYLCDYLESIHPFI